MKFIESNFDHINVTLSLTNIRCCMSNACEKYLVIQYSFSSSARFSSLCEILLESDFDSGKLSLDLERRNKSHPKR